MKRLRTIVGSALGAVSVITGMAAFALLPHPSESRRKPKPGDRVEFTRVFGPGDRLEQGEVLIVYETDEGTQVVADFPEAGIANACWPGEVILLKEKDCG